MKMFLIFMYIWKNNFKKQKRTTFLCNEKKQVATFYSLIFSEI